RRRARAARDAGAGDDARRHTGCRPQHRRRVPGARGDPDTGGGPPGAGARAGWAGPTTTTTPGRAGHPAVAAAAAPSTEHRGPRRTGPAAHHTRRLGRSADGATHLSRHVAGRWVRAGPWVAD